MVETVKKAASTLVPEQSFGRNQLILIGALVTPFVMMSVRWFTGAVTTAEWTGLLSSYVWPGLVAMLGGATLIKGIRAFKGQD